MSSTQNVITVANDLIANHTKNDLINMSRSMGWRGDHARTPILVFALFIASKTTTDDKQPESSQQFKSELSKDDSTGEQAEKTEQGEQFRNHDGDDKGQQQPQGEQGQQQNQDQAKSEQDAQQDQQQPKSDQGEQDQPKQPQQQQDDQQQPKQSQQPQQPQQDAQQPQQREPEPDDTPEHDHGDDFERLLKKSGINKPHRLLEKAWRLTALGGLNLMLSGPAGAGKTTLAHQLAQLLSVPFASVSCTTGMSESQLTGWLLPVGDNGKFDYVSSPFIRSIQEPSVFLLDELDAADSNVVLAMNSLLANGFLTVAHKLDCPTVMRHRDSLIIAGVNSVGGGDDIYTARTILDGSTLDRFYIMSIDYDESFESELFNKSKRAGKKSPKWEKSTTVVDQTVCDELKKYFFGIRRTAEKSQIRQIVSTRFAQKLLAAAESGVPVAEVKQDLLSAWTIDERARVAGL